MNKTASNLSSRCLWLVTARAGSKSVADKNIRPLCGRPLIEYKIKTALSISPKENVWVSTDSAKYAEISKAAGATVPFMRPAELATDHSLSVDVVLHAMAEAEKKGLSFDYIGLLEPTSPFIYFEDLENALKQLDLNSSADAIVACRESRPNSIFVQDESEFLGVVSKNIEQLKNSNRQALVRQITPSGGFYISRWNALKSGKSFYSEKTLAYTVPEECGLEIDDPIDWTFAEFLIEKKIMKMEKVFK